MPVTQDGPGFYQELSWSPDGEILLVSVLEFRDAEPGYAYRIWRLRAAGGAAVPLTAGPRDYRTSWSPGGDRIAFAGVTDTGKLDVFVMHADGTGRRRLTHDPADDTQPAWSPDGRVIVFISDREERAQIWIMEADGSAPRRLVSSPGEAQNPSWSPDGSHIAYYETDQQGDDHVVIVRADGSERRRLTEGLWPTWTPDGRGIVFSGEDGLYRMPLDGGTAELMLGGNVVAGELSPDGTRLAAIVQDSAAVSVMVSTADGQNSRVLMTRPPPPW